MDDKGCGPSSLQQGYLKLREKTHQPKLDIEGESNDSHTINVSSLSTPSLFSNQCQGTPANKPPASLPKPILTRIFQSLPINNNNNNNNTTVNHATLEAKAMFTMGFAALIGLLSVTYKINGHGNLVPTAIIHQPTFTFTFFLIIIMMTIYFPAIGMVIEEAFPKITKVLNVISFVCIVLGVTVLLWSLTPNRFGWIPWVFFACTATFVFRILVYGRFTDKSSTLRPTVSLEV